MGNSTEVMVHGGPYGYEIGAPFGFERALSLLKEGKKLTRNFEHKYVVYDSYKPELGMNLFRADSGIPWRPTTADLLAEDWRVYA